MRASSLTSCRDDTLWSMLASKPATLRPSMSAVSSDDIELFNKHSRAASIRIVAPGAWPRLC